MLNEYQEVKVMKILIKTGKITRNQCLRMYISRLSAIIFELKERGWVFKSGYVKTAYGKDYAYYLVSRPKVK
jgi:hypothetical protein